jgi:hypothetical protein
MLLLLFVLAATQHDISKVDPVTAPDAVIATPVPERQQKRLKKYDIPELAGAKQALGSQLIDGRLPKPIADYVAVEGTIEQRISLFEGGLVVVRMTGAGTMYKKVIIPPDALAEYRRVLSVASLQTVDQRELSPAEARHRGVLRVYADDGSYVERVFHPGRVPPKQLNDHVAPLRDLLRVISEDRGVTTSLAGYQPKEGDQLVADDHKIYEVVRIAPGAGVVELRCLDAPTRMYIAKKDLHLYFLGRRGD